MSKLSGWKTIIGVALAAALLAAAKLEWLTTDQVEWALIAVGTWTGVAIRQAIRKAEK